MKLASNEKCLTDATKNITSQINFLCSAKVDAPVFFAQNDCNLQFNWETPLACNNRTECLINDPRTGFT